MTNPYRQVEKELLWYFNHSDAAIGFKSSHSSFVAAVYGVSSTTINTDPYTDGTLRQIKKIRQIRDTFLSLPLHTRRALEACYNLEYCFFYPPEIVRIYGHKTGASLFNTQVHDVITMTKLCQKKIQSKLAPNEEVIMFNIGEETRLLWNSINQQYLDARQKLLNDKSKK